MRPPRARHRQWQPGITVVIPERDAPDLLQEALAALSASLSQLPEPTQVIVVANGAPRVVYAALEARYPSVEFVHSALPLGFVAAIERGLARARHDWVLLLNNDMKIAEGAVAALCKMRAPDVFAIGAQIFQQSASGRREETGFTDWYIDGNGVHLFHAPPDHAAAVPQLCASGGAALFRTEPLQHYLAASHAYDPFYWEDAEWSVRAWRDGWRVLFAPDAHAIHRHRATTSRFYEPAELERIIERNRLLFDTRHGITPEPRAMLMIRICDLPYRSQRELARMRVAVGVFRQRAQSRREPQPMPAPVLWNRNRAFSTLAAASYSYRLRTTQGSVRPKLLVVTPFAVFPARHGGARRVAELLHALRRDHDIILVSDEAGLYDARSFAFFSDLCDIRLVEREDAGIVGTSSAVEARMRDHLHGELQRAVAGAIADHRPALIQVEYAELAGLVRMRTDEQRWILGLHDAFGPGDFSSREAFACFERQTLAAYDAVTVCSDEDAGLVRHPHVVRVPNGSVVPLGAYTPSASLQLLFIGPFRYEPNLDGILEFLKVSYPTIRVAVPGVALLILCGDEGVAIAPSEPAFLQPGVCLVGHRDDVPSLLAASALTINPLRGIRGSAVKLVESLTAGRVCVSTEEGARGFGGADLSGLVTVRDVAAMAEPIIRLLSDATERHRRETPVTERLRGFQWESCAELQRRLYASLLRAPSPSSAPAHAG
ncbi:MAG: glycosyltransferase [Betaproteobacteria bacterium]